MYSLNYLFLVLFGNKLINCIHISTLHICYNLYGFRGYFMCLVGNTLYGSLAIFIWFVSDTLFSYQAKF